MQKYRVKGIDGLTKLQKRIKVTVTALPQYQLYLARKISEHDLLSAIHSTMKGYDVSQKIIDSTKITRVEFAGNKKIRIHITSRYFAGSFDVAKARHDGTKPHWIEPTEKKALHFNGFFSKGHDISGLSSLKYITDTIQRLRQHIEDELNRQTRIWVNQMLEVN